MNGRVVFKRPWQKWLAGFVFWTLVGLFFSIQAYYYFSARRQGYTFADALKGTMPQWYTWGALSFLIVRLDRYLNIGGENILHRALIHLPLGIGWTLLYVFIEACSDRLVFGKMPSLSLPYFAGELQWNLPNYWLIVGISFAYQYHNESRNRELKASRLEAQLAKAHLQSLKMQLHPHFLFNALNTISAYMEKDPKTARRMAAHLGDLLRFSLEKSDVQEITLAEELALLEHYLEIQRVRFEERLQVKIEVAPETLEAMVPSLLLQPLVENSIRHGIAPRASGGTIEVQARQENGKLHLQVCDNGVGLSEGWQHRVGLSNTIAVLAQLYNSEHGFEIRNRPEGGVVVEIVLPFIV